MAGFNYTWLEREAFTETGADSLNLDVKSETWNSLVSSLGFRAHRIFEIDPKEGWRWIPEMQARWAHEFGDRDRPLTGRLSGATAGAFRVLGATAARDGALIGAGWTVTRAEDLALFIHYDLSWNPDLIGHAVSGGLLYRW